MVLLLVNIAGFNYVRTWHKLDSAIECISHDGHIFIHKHNKVIGKTARMYRRIIYVKYNPYKVHERNVYFQGGAKIIVETVVGKRLLHYVLWLRNTPKAGHVAFQTKWKPQVTPENVNKTKKFVSASTQIKNILRGFFRLIRQQNYVRISR
jgi:hypothetical protein